MTIFIYKAAMDKTILYLIESYLKWPEVLNGKLIQNKVW